VSDRVDLLARAFITELNNGQFRKGMLMQFVEESILKNIAAKKGVLKQEIEEVTHTQISTAAAVKADKIIARKEEARAAEYRRIRGRMINHMCLIDIDPASKLSKSQMDKIIIVATGLKARSIDNKRKELLAYGVITESYGYYRIAEETVLAS
jgi:hypothetical protein